MLEPYHFGFASFGFFREEWVIRSSILPIMLCLDVYFFLKMIHQHHSHFKNQVISMCVNMMIESLFIKKMVLVLKTFNAYLNERSTKKKNVVNG